MRLFGHLAIAALAGALGCSSDGGSAADAAPPDAVTLSDGGSGGDGGGSNGTPFTMISCSGSGADAGAGAPDAMPAPLTDAGPAPGLDEACCNPEGACGDDFACIEGPEANRHLCRPLCNLADNLCPLGGVCASFGGQGVCVEAGSEGEACAPELCEADTICVGADAEAAVCRRRCEAQEECDEGTTCTALSGAGAMACL